MKFMLLIYGPETFHLLTPEQQMAVIGAHQAFIAEMTAAAVYHDGSPLMPSMMARTVRSGSVEDGPFADSKEQLGGYYVIDVADLDAAVGWARKCPVAEGYGVEVRQLPSYG
jgi:hypothetical protein